MASSNASRTVEIVVKGHSNVNGKKIRNIFHYTQSVISGSTTKVTLGNIFGELWNANMPGLLSEDYKGDEITVRNIEDPTDPETPAVTTPADGTVDGDSLPLQNTVTVQLKTALRGRNFRGSKHFSPIAESETEFDELDATAVTSWLAGIAWMAQILTDPDSGSAWTPAVYSPSLSTFTSIPYTIVMTGVGSLVLNKTIGGLKKRKEKTVSGGTVVP